MIDFSENFLATNYPADTGTGKEIAKAVEYCIAKGWNKIDACRVITEEIQNFRNNREALANAFTHRLFARDKKFAKNLANAICDAEFLTYTIGLRCVDKSGEHAFVKIEINRSNDDYLNLRAVDTETLAPVRTRTSKIGRVTRSEYSDMKNRGAHDNDCGIDLMRRCGFSPVSIGWE